MLLTEDKDFGLLAHALPHEIESYLLHPDALSRFVEYSRRWWISRGHEGDLRRHFP